MIRTCPAHPDQVQPGAFFIDFVVLRIIISFVGDIIYMDGVRHITEDDFSMVAFIPIIVLLTVLLKYGVLRLYLPRMDWWALATTAGWLVGFLLIFIPNWQYWINMPTKLKLSTLLPGYNNL
jgi:hypothetical protein